jgi:tetrahedral aminopeptidase
VGHCPREFHKRVARPPENLKPVFDRLKRIIEIPATPGYEQGIARQLVEEWTPLCDDVQVDHMGNVYGIRRGAADGPALYCPAHSDSCSFIVESIEKDGYLRFENQGLVPPFLSYGQRMVIITPEGPVTGVCGTQAGHSHFNFGGAEGKYYPPELVATPMYDEQFIDVGATSRTEALAMGIRPGQQMVFDRDLRWLGDGSSGAVTCRGLDDKVGIEALTEALMQVQGKDIYPTLYMVGAVQEEIGLRGAGNAGGLIGPDLCVGVDGTISEAGPNTNQGFGVGVSPNLTMSEAATSLGNGVYISINDIVWGIAAGLYGNPRLNEKLIDVAEARGIKYEIEGSMPYITSDPAHAQYLGAGGTPSVTLKVPIRYTHGPVEACSLWDVVETGKLLGGFIEDLDASFDLAFINIKEAHHGPRPTREL